MKSGLLVAAALGAFLVFAIASAVYIWRQMADVEIGTHGTIALTLGAVAAIGLGVGLMRLVFYSSRHGYDEQAGDDR